MFEEAGQEVNGRLESLGVAGSHEPVVRVEGYDEGADLSERDVTDGEETLSLADDYVHHEVKYDGGDRATLGDAVPRLERKPLAAGGFTNQDPAVRKGFYQPPRLGSNPAVLQDLQAAAPVHRIVRIAQI